MTPLPIDAIAGAIGADIVGEPAGAVIRRVMTDSRSMQDGDLFVAIRGERFDGHDFVEQALAGGAKAAVVARGCAIARAGTRFGPLLIVQDPVRALGALANYYRREVLGTRTKVVGVTGSNGKTTTKELIHHLLSEARRGSRATRSFNNEIGVPLTLLSADAGDDYVVVELGTNAPGEIAALGNVCLPDVGVITSVGEAHLLGLGSLEGIAAEKSALLRYLPADGLAVISADSEVIRPHVASCGVRETVLVGRSVDADKRVRMARTSLSGSEFTIEGSRAYQLPLIGCHHAVNAALALEVARWFGLPEDQLAARLATFQTGAGRVHARVAGSVTIIDDSYNANPASVAEAINTLACLGTPRRRVLILGDMHELGDASEILHEEVVRKASTSAIDLLIGIGPFMERALSCDRNSSPTGTMGCESTGQAVTRIPGMIAAGDLVWVKGSRVMQLERVVEAIAQRWDRGVAVA